MMEERQRKIVIKTWDVTVAYINSRELNNLLAGGWEPFSVTMSGLGGTIWLRKEKYITKDNNDGEKTKSIG